MSRMAISMGAVAALACASPLGAHHSISTVDITTPVWVKGSVVRYEIGNPHTMIELDATTLDGGPYGGPSTDRTRAEPNKWVLTTVS